MNIHSIYRVFLRHFRSKRMLQFKNTFSIRDTTRILDVGGDQYNWQFIDVMPLIKILNLAKPIDWEDVSNISFCVGDGTSLQFPDKSYDVAYSNSVIEHLGSWENQQMFAQELMRVGKAVYVQTPAKEFFIEPHLLTPCIHWLPLPLQAKLMRNFTLWGLITRPSRQFIDDFLKERRLLTYAEFCNLFPGCEIIRERVMGLTKSYIAIRVL